MTAPESMMAPSTMASGGRGSMPDVHELVLVTALAARLQLHGLDGRGADVDADEPFLLTEQSHGCLSLSGGSDVLRLTFAVPPPSGNGTCARRIRTYEQIVKVLHEASRGPRACQAKNEASCLAK